MIRYRKGVEPTALSAHRATPGADWDGFRGRQDVRETLVRDQQGICAYCQQFIAATPAMKIDHWLARNAGTGGKEQELAWSNLVGACPGTNGVGSARQTHCDTHRGNHRPIADQRLHLHPVEGKGPDPRDRLRYGPDGKAYVFPGSTEVDHDIALLNLNCDYLVRNRRQVLQQLEAHLKKVGFTRRHIETRLRKLDETPTQFAEVAREYLRRKLRQVS